MNYYDYIEDYCEGKLETTEKALLESEMDSNGDLSAQIENYRAGKLLAEGFLEIDIMETIEKLEEKERTSKIDTIGHQSRFALNNLLMAATFIGLLGMASWWIFQYGTNDISIDWGQYEPPYNDSATKSTDLSGMSDLEKGKYYFSLNDFDKSESVLLLFMNSSENDTAVDEAHFWLAHVYTNQKKLDKAYLELGQTTDDRKSKLLSFLKKNDNSK